MPKILTKKMFQKKLGDSIEVLEFTNHKSPCLVHCKKCGKLYKILPACLDMNKVPCFICRGSKKVPQITFEYLIEQEGFERVMFFEDASRQLEIRCMKCGRIMWYLPSDIIHKPPKCDCQK